MKSDAQTLPPTSLSQKSKPHVLLLAIIALGFLALRVPLMARQQAGTDEAFFAVPGRTILEEGVPRIPYLPVRDKTSVFYQSDQILFCLPPAFFYWQAIFFAALPDSLLTARLASATAGLLLLGLLYLLGRQHLQNPMIGIWAAALFSLSRLFYFPATSTRPDMFCGFWGLAALLAAWKWSRERQRKPLIASGLCLGLGLLTHPYAIVYCLQIGLWVLLVRQDWKARLLDVGLLVACALVTFSLWIPLVLLDPETCWVQFSNNVLDRAGPGIIARLVMPWPSLQHHFMLLVEHAQVPQLVLMIAGLFGTTALAIQRKERGLVTLAMLSWSSIYLLVSISGVHPVKGYWCYPGALLHLCIAVSLWHLVQHVATTRTSLFTTTLAVTCMLPGLGLKTWCRNVQHWPMAAYNQPSLVREIMATLPANKSLWVDPAFVFDVHLAGAQATFGSLADLPISKGNVSYDYLILGPLGRHEEAARQFNAQLVAEFGDPDDPFACFAQVYQVPEEVD